MGKKKTTQSRKRKKTLKQSRPEKITTGLDPHLQEVILRARAGERLGPAFAQSSLEDAVSVDVIAKLTSDSAEVDGLHIARRIGRIVTGTIDVEHIEEIRNHADVLSLKRATSLRRELEFSVDEINADATSLSGIASNLDGTGVIVGIIDYGCDFNHGNFRNSSGETRLLYFWDQSGGNTSISPAGFGYGREFDSAAINEALGSPSPYNKLKHDPGIGSHGTHVMDIATGNGSATGYPGVASNAGIIFVNIPSDGIEAEDDVEDDETFDLGNSKMLLEAVDYIFEKADELGMPAVVNISLSAQGGPHDGSTLVEQALDHMLGTPGRAITIAAGNSYRLSTHASGSVTKSEPRELTWIFRRNDKTNNELEVWYSGDSELQASLTTSTGDSLPLVKLGTTVTLEDNDGLAGRIIHRKGDPNNGDNHIDIILSPKIATGKWKVTLTTNSSDPVDFHAWVELDPFGKQSKLSEADDDRTYTLGSISCGHKTIAVGSYMTGDPDFPISSFSASGPTRDGRKKPEISAPGQFLKPAKTKGIQAAKSGTQGSTRESGTSMAAPHVAGVIALMMQLDNSITSDEIRNHLFDSAREPQSYGWHPRFGFGRLDAQSSLSKQSLIGASPLAANQRDVGDTISYKSTDEFEKLIEAVARVAKRTKTKLSVEIKIDPSDERCNLE